MKTIRGIIAQKRNRIPAIMSLLTVAMVLGMAGTQPAFATHYWSGWWWTNISHPGEFKTISGDWYVPFYLEYSELDDLPFVDGQDPEETSEDAIEDAADGWNGISSACGLTHDDTQTGGWDHSVGTTDFGSVTLAVTSVQLHGVEPFDDDHIVQADTNINDDTDDFQWDYLDENVFTTPPTVDLRKVMLHEFGHWAFLCDTYSGGNTEANLCDGDLVETSVMDDYEAGEGENLSSHDEDKIIGIYGG
ncbi:MAG TPA: hypothetical protein VF172_12500 [Nitrososphaera sp.]|jgi:hypothetical protein